MMLVLVLLSAILSSVMADHPYTGLTGAPSVSALIEYCQLLKASILLVQEHHVETCGIDQLSLELAALG